MLNTKKCTSCKTIKDLSAFTRANSKKSGYQSHCKRCVNKYATRHIKTKAGLVSKIFKTQKISSKSRGHIQPTYTKEELREWLYSKPLFHILYDNWKRLDYQKNYIPSVDRKDDDIGYTMDNIQLMTWGENNLKGHKDHKSGKLVYDQRAVLQYTKDGKFVTEYHSIREAGRQTNNSPSNILYACIGKRKSAGGFKWKIK